MKKIMNKSENMVLEMCNGIALAHPELEFVKKFKVLKKKNINKAKVTLISGGGSGHEPAHAGFIGKGMLDAAICGDVFASPSQIQIFKGIQASASDKGTLLIIKNYSGDMMNFKNAAHLASEEGIQVDFVKVDDDIAVNDSLYTVGRRGVAGTIFVHKIAGAAAQRGQSLAEVKAVAEKVIANVRSLGFALTSCTVPAKGSATFELADNEMEYGVGIHGEPGIERCGVLTAQELSVKMVSAVVGDLKLAKGDEIAIMVNGFGGSPLSELYLLNHSVMRQLSAKGLRVCKTLVGNYMTSLDMCGASLSVLKLDAELKSLLADECDTPALKFTGLSPEVAFEEVGSAGGADVDYACSTAFTPIANEQVTLANLTYIVDKMSEIIINNEIPFCELDSFAGDGDFGMSVAKGFKQLKKEWNEILLSKNIFEFLDACSIVIMEHCGGASGPIWGSAFRAASKATKGKETLSLQDFANMLQGAVVGIQDTGKRSFGRGAVVGDKTLIDALVPCADAFTAAAKAGDCFANALEAGAKAAVAGAKSTEDIVARMGRAGTVGERSLGHPDAGAFALGVIFTQICESVIK